MDRKRQTAGEEDTAHAEAVRRAVGRRLLPWFEANRRDLPWRKEPREAYAVWVSEIMLQQTRVDTVVPYFARFMERFPSPEALAAAPLQDVLKVWEGLGYYARARQMKAAAERIVTEHGGRIPASADPGVGGGAGGATGVRGVHGGGGRVVRVRAAAGGAGRERDTGAVADFRVPGRCFGAGGAGAVPGTGGGAVAPRASRRMQRGVDGARGAGLPAARSPLRGVSDARRLPRAAGRPRGGVSGQ